MGFGGAIKLTGETEYKKALKQITQNLKEVSSEVKLVSSAYDKNDKSTKALAAQSEVLNKQLQEQKAKVDLLNAEYARMAKEQNADSVSMSKLRTEINKAQADVNNTAKAIDNLGKETEESGKQAEKSSEGYTIFKNILANLATQAIHSVLNGLKSLGVAFVNLGKQALNSYAELEQLQGGVEKLFGDDSAKTVMKNANKAFRTAGLSANEYMETVTSFSAALISGLKGDTEKSAEIADIAIRDMADNANTFGTDIASIQNAYQGFAKQNYTMLDNLKLGYGGTASEMARLVNESGVLGDAMKVTAQTVKDIPFAQVILAINKTQERMGVLGTTAKEASGTIEGSFNSTKSAWQNLITNMANDQADYKTLISDFVGSLTSSMQNTLPRIKTIIEGAGNLFGELVKKIVPELLKSIPKMVVESTPILLESIRNLIASVSEVLPQLVSVAGDLLDKVLKSILDHIPDVLKAIKSVIPSITSLISNLLSNIGSHLPEFIQTGIDLCVSLFHGIASELKNWIGQIPKIVKDVCISILDNIGQIIDVGIELVMGLIDGLVSALPELVSYIPTIIEKICGVLIANMPKIIEAAIVIINTLVSGLTSAMPQLIDMIPEIVFTIVRVLAENLPQIIMSGVKIIGALIEGIGNSIGGLFSNIKEIGKNVIKRFLEAIVGIWDVGKKIVEGIWKGISDGFNWIKGKITEWVGNIVDFFKNLLGIHSPSRVFETQIGKYMAEGIGKGFSEEMKLVSAEMQDSIPTSFDVSPTITRGADAFGEMVQAFKDALYDVKIELDDEVAGRFVENTVARSIYA